MCYNPLRVLACEYEYDGIPRNLLLFDTTDFEYEVGCVIIKKGENDHRLTRRMLNQIIKHNIHPPFYFTKRMELPCGKCLECTKARADEWSVRCQLESSLWRDNYFVTLTYNEQNVPWNHYTEYAKTEDDEPVRCHTRTLRKKHLSKFMKSLRQIQKRDRGLDNIRFFACGEYGTCTHRPHYHAILFNCPLDDLQFLKNSKSGFTMYRSATLERAWPYGFVTVQRYSIECARYVAQYCTKKLYKTESALARKEMEFINMSRRPGIAADWFNKNVEKLITPHRIGDSLEFSTKLTLASYNEGKVEHINKPIPKYFYRRFKRFSNAKLNKNDERGPYGDCAIVIDGDYYSGESVYYNQFRPFQSKTMDSCRDMRLLRLGCSAVEYLRKSVFDDVMSKKRDLANRFKVNRDLCLTFQNTCDIIKEKIHCKRYHLGPKPNTDIISGERMCLQL